ncbi:MAG: hypothetical protein K2L67_06875 [Clostridia bacterium]|nr:hypothetical protein [Clostridia bacterium]
MIYNIVIAILSFMLCGDLVFLGILSQDVLITFNPSFYGWGIAFYVCAGFFGVWFIACAVRGIIRKRRKIARHHSFNGAHPHDNTTNKTRKTPARNSNGQRKRSKK